MEKIPSFTIDHTRLLRGIYVSRSDVTPHGDTLTTFDIRLTEPNRQQPVTPQAMHTLEHLGATFLRNDPEWKDRMIYWGPMGCMTGFYLILQGKLTPEDILPILTRTYNYMSEFEGEIPGATPQDCGNYQYNDLETARKVARRFLDEVLLNIKEENINYPPCRDIIS